MHTLHEQHTLGPKGRAGPNQKIALIKIYLKFNFRSGLFNAKMPNSKNFILTPLYEMKKIIVLKIYLGTLA
jgi:hypothetical protein